MNKNLRNWLIIALVVLAPVGLWRLIGEGAFMIGLLAALVVLYFLGVFDSTQKPSERRP